MRRSMYMCLMTILSSSSSMFEAASNIEFEDDKVVIKHMYIERRMQPLNLYLQEVAQDRDETRMRRVLRDYGCAIKELAGAGIFPGDMLVKNFGMTRHDRVVFYDYDEIEYMTDCVFRRIPPPRTPEDEMSAEPYWSVGPNDVYPEQFASFLVTGHKAREAFLEHHADLMDPAFWAGKQERIRAGLQEDVFPYPIEIRFPR